MAARFKEAFGADSQLIEGGGGVFDVKVDGELVFSKHDCGDFPDENALIQELSNRQPA